MYEVNYSNIVNHKVQPQSFDDLILQAYCAGLITKYSDLIIYGTGAERGTFTQFANLHMSNFPSQESKLAITYFTNLYSKAIRNRCKTTRKTNFYLSQIQELTPLLNVFGLQDLFQEEWDNVASFDKANNLRYEYSQKGCIHNWEKRTMKVTIPLINLQVEILEAITDSIMSKPYAQFQPTINGSHKELIQLAFIEGLRGLLIGSSDLNMLRKGDPILSQYVA